jgi:cobalt-zinc-cadmium efflux system protein
LNRVSPEFKLSYMHVHAGHGHAHDHGHDHGHQHEHLHEVEGASRVLRFSLLVTLGYIVLLVISGIRAHSLALLSEAGHNVSDFLALLLSLVAVFLESRAPSSTKTFGYQRAGVIAAFVNSVTLVIIAFFIFYEAARRLHAPEHVQPGLMIGVAAIGVAMNGIIALMLYRKGRSDLNLRSVFLHMLGDTLSTMAVIAGGWAIMATGRWWIDPALSFGIGALIVWSSLGIIRDTLNILLEGMPRGMEQQRIMDAVTLIPGVNAVHDLHVWSIGSQSHALSCHIAIADIPPSESEAILQRIQVTLREMFRIHHSTIQFEHPDKVCETANGCVILPARPLDPHGHAH